MADNSSRLRPKAERRADRTRHQMTTGVLARLLDMDQRTVHMWTQRGILPSTFVAASGRSYYDRHHVAAALAAAGHTVPQSLGAGCVPLPDKIRSAYVAGPSRELDRCEQVMARLRASGVRITHDWAASVRRIEGLGTALLDAEQEQEAIADLGGVASADVLIVLTPRNGISSCWVEMGAALALCRPVILSLGDCPLRTVFEALVHVRRDDDAACRSVERHADRSVSPVTGMRRPRGRGRTALIPTPVTVE
jgi:hypothetical protein